jgi:hypothetical protein
MSGDGMAGSQSFVSADPAAALAASRPSRSLGVDGHPCCSFRTHPRLPIRTAVLDRVPAFKSPLSAKQQHPRCGDLLLRPVSVTTPSPRRTTGRVQSPNAQMVTDHIPS